MRYLVLLLTAIASLNVAFANTDEQAVETTTETVTTEIVADTTTTSEVEVRDGDLQ